MHSSIVKMHVARMKLYLHLLCLLILLNSHSLSAGALAELLALDSSSILLVDSQNRPILNKDPLRMQVPASTVKLITALAALDRWGRRHQFKTEFYWHEFSNTLLVRGLGDPFLISEELDLIVNKIKGHDIHVLNAVRTDTSYFSNHLQIDGQGKSTNPYDSVVSALAANFNTIEVDVASNHISSAEPQTPITPMATSLAASLGNGRHRINLGGAHNHHNSSAEYFTQLLVAKLQLAGVQVLQQQTNTPITIENSELLFTHHNSHSLEQVIKAMLEYSNNFIANQIFLLLGVEHFEAPAQLDKSMRMIASYVQNKFHWQDFVLREGSGLSRANRLSASQLIDVLIEFAPYRDLMPQQSSYILAKSGTLRGVSCYAGYLLRQDEWHAFAMLINQPVKYHFREQVAKELLNYGLSGE